MKNLAPLLLFTWSGGAFAQSAVLVEIDDTTLEPGQSTTVMLSAAWPSAEYAFAVIGTGIMMPDGVGAWSDMELIPVMDGPGTSPGVATSQGVNDILGAQLNFGPGGFEPDFSNPIRFWRGTFTAPDIVATAYEFDLTTITSRFEVYIEPMSHESRSYLADVVEGRETIRVIPAPASLALLGLSGLVLGRRRR